MRSDRKFMATVLVGLLTVIPLGLPQASSEFVVRHDDAGRLILPDGYRKLTNAEFMDWYCNLYPDRCTLKRLMSRADDSLADPGPGPGC